MFPDFELETLKMILQDNQYDLEKTMEDLFKMNDQKETSSNLPQPKKEDDLNIKTNKDQEETSAFDDNANELASAPQLNTQHTSDSHRLSQDELDEMLAFEMQLKYQQREMRLQQQIDEEVKRRIEVNDKYKHEQVPPQNISFDNQLIQPVNQTPQNFTHTIQNQTPVESQPKEQKIRLNEITIEEITFKFDSNK